MQTAIKLFSLKLKLMSLPPATLAVLAQLRQQKKPLRDRKFKIRDRIHQHNK